MTGSALVIDGKSTAARLVARVAKGAARLKADGVQPGLAVVLVGDDPASHVYVRNKVRRSAEAGLRSFEHRLAATTPESELLALVRRLNADPDVHGILVQMPLPAHIDAATVILAIDPAKDVDGLHPQNAGSLVLGRPGLVPCTPQGCMLLIREHRGPDLSGLDALVIGRSVLVGKPVALLLQNANCTVTMAHSRTRNLVELCGRADILVAAIGRPEFVRGDWVKPGATVIDVGMNRVGERLTGDVAFAEAAAVAGAITPAPGGVGPMTIACLLRNTLLAAAAQAKLPPPEV